MAKYQRNLALSLVRTRSARYTDASEKGQTTLDISRAAHAAGPSENVSAPLPLLRGEIDGLRGGTTREGRRLEDWHPESLVAMWCTSLMAGRDGINSETRGGGAGWAKGRMRTLSVLRWVAQDSEPTAGGVLAGTVVPFLEHGTLGGSSVGTGERGLGRLRACFATYVSDRLEDEQFAEAKSAKESARGSSSHDASPAPSIRRLPHASTRHFIKGAKRAATPATARDIADTAAAAGVPRRLLSLSGGELSALSALLDEALGQELDVSNPSVSRSVASNASAGDTAAALFSSANQLPPSPSSPSQDSFKSTVQMPSVPAPLIAVAPEMPNSSSLFLLARGLRARLDATGGAAGNRGGAGKKVDTGIAVSAAVGMLFSPSSAQKDVLEILCPKVGGGPATAGKGLTWGDAKAMMLPIWVRDVSELRRVTEALAANTFRQDRDLMAVSFVPKRLA